MIAIHEKSALVDNDFLNHVLEIKGLREGDIAGLFQEVLSGMGLEPIIHPLVFQHEVLDVQRVRSFFDRDIVKKPTFEDIHNNDEGKKAYYQLLIPELYKKLKGVALSDKNEDYFTFWKRLHSLGEIHSIATCLITNCGVFLSDDSDSLALQEIIKNDFATSVAVYNRSAAVEEAQNNGAKIRRERRKAFAHV